MRYNRIDICDWCGEELSMPVERKIHLTDKDGVVLDNIDLCEECSIRPIVIKNGKTLDSGD